MFTGIIEEIGIVKQLVPGKVSYRLTVSAKFAQDGFDFVLLCLF